MTRPTRRWCALVLAASLAVAACGDDDGADVRNIGGEGSGTGSGSPTAPGSGSPSAPASGSPTAPASGSPTEAGE